MLPLDLIELIGRQLDSPLAVRGLVKAAAAHACVCTGIAESR